MPTRHLDKSFVNSTSSIFPGALHLVATGSKVLGKDTRVAQCDFFTPVQGRSFGNQ